MSVEDIDRRLDDRFALLRGGDRSAPDRHQTLIAVIDWSLEPAHRGRATALRWLSVFHDGFTLAGADDGARTRRRSTQVQSLVDQSLLTVIDAAGAARYRMLETVREFGRMQLVGAGEDVAARDAQLRLGRGVRRARRSRALIGPRTRSRRCGILLAEENNLADCLREALRHPDQCDRRRS